MLMRKTLTTPTLGLVLAALVAATPASADWSGRHDGRYAGRGHGYHRSHGWGGGAVAAGIIGGLALGALAAGASRHSYAAPAYAVEPDYEGPVCYRDVRPVHDAWGRYMGERAVRVCD